MAKHALLPAVVVVAVEAAYVRPSSEEAGLAPLCAFVSEETVCDEEEWFKAPLRRPASKARKPSWWTRHAARPSATARSDAALDAGTSDAASPATGSRASIASESTSFLR